MNYQQRLFDAVKSSYAYLFYDRLEHDFENATQKQKSAPLQNRIPNDVDIQTQDIYNAASNDIITKLYQSKARTKKMFGNTHIEYLPTTATDDSAQTAISNKVAMGGRATDQVKVMTVQVGDYGLNVHLPNEDQYLQNAREQNRW